MTKVTDHSGSFTDKEEETRVRKFAKHMLKSSLFIGTFLEKRYVEHLHSYRDVIRVADDEADLKDNLKVVRNRCLKYFKNDVWIGITEPKTVGAPTGYSLWVTLNEEVFGSYWYKIKNVQFYPNEVCVKLEVVRPVKISHNLASKQIPHEQSETDVSQTFQETDGSFKDVMSEVFTWSNCKGASIFVILLISTLITFLLQAIKYLLDFILKLLHEISDIIKVCTPLIISFMKLIMNTINGLYTLIAVMWCNRSIPKVNPYVYQISPYQMPYEMKALPYKNNFPKNRRHRSSVKITPLD